ncbi:hypothetical protein PoB_005207800 [Plakobranchus ocellatus]|uniref:Uncharacterized protein n=1 Tax=Plakobranchus ocellatus TaxID=259542 RepID=A0AAV4C3K5_9GAST|nr:hypothetical protein PoB_005207800 [Plakobranchus ocellatus]
MTISCKLTFQTEQKLETANAISQSVKYTCSVEQSSLQEGYGSIFLSTLANRTAICSNLETVDTKHEAHDVGALLWRCEVEISTKL